MTSLIKIKHTNKQNKTKKKKKKKKKKNNKGGRAGMGGGVASKIVFSKNAKRNIFLISQPRGT